MWIWSTRIRSRLSSGGWTTVITNLRSKKVERTRLLVLGDCRLIGVHGRFPRLRHPRLVILGLPRGLTIGSPFR